MIIDGGGDMSKNDFKDQRRYRILELATKCLAEKPNASLNEIATYSEIGIATLHRYFSSRDNLLNTISYRAIELVEDAIERIDFSEPDIRVLIKKTAEVLIPLGDSIYFLFAEIFNTDDIELVNKELIIWDRFIDEFRKRQSIGQLRSDLKVEWIFKVTYNMMFMLWKAIHDGNIAAKDAPEILMTTLLDGFKG